MQKQRLESMSLRVIRKLSGMSCLRQSLVKDIILIYSTVSQQSQKTFSCMVAFDAYYCINSLLSSLWTKLPSFPCRAVFSSSMLKTAINFNLNLTSGFPQKTRCLEAFVTQINSRKSFSNSFGFSQRLKRVAFHQVTCFLSSFNGECAFYLFFLPSRHTNSRDGIELLLPSLFRHHSWNASKKFSDQKNLLEPK